MDVVETHYILVSLYSDWFTWMNPVIKEHGWFYSLGKTFFGFVSFKSLVMEFCIWVSGFTCALMELLHVRLKVRAEGLTFDQEKAWTGAKFALWFNLCVARISIVLLYMTVNLIL